MSQFLSCIVADIFSVEYCRDVEIWVIGAVKSLTRSSAVAERPRDASCLSRVSFNIPTAQFLYY